MSLPINKYYIDSKIFNKLILEYVDRQNYIKKLLCKELVNNDEGVYLISPWLIYINNTTGVYAHNQTDGETVSYLVDDENLRIYQDEFLRWVDYKLRFGYLNTKELIKYFEGTGILTQIFKAKKRGEITNLNKAFNSFMYNKTI